MIVARRNSSRSREETFIYATPEIQTHREEIAPESPYLREGIPHIAEAAERDRDERDPDDVGGDEGRGDEDGAHGGGAYLPHPGMRPDAAYNRRMTRLTGVSPVLLVGEPGIGKTRTVQELETYARIRGDEKYLPDSRKRNLGLFTLQTVEQVRDLVRVELVARETDEENIDRCDSHGVSSVSPPPGRSERPAEHRPRR